MSEEKRKSIRDAYAKWKENPELNSEQLVKCLEDYRTAWTMERRKSHEGQWRLNAAFYAGNHFVRDTGGGQYRVRLKENHTNNTMNRMLSIFMQNLPVTRVFSNSSDHSDDQKAKSTEEWLKYLHRKKQMELKWAKLIKYSCGFGSGFIYRGWDADAGGKMLLDAGETESGRPEVKMWSGDNCVEVDDPFKIAVRPGIDEMEDMYDIIRSKPVNRWSLSAAIGKDIDADGAKAMDAYTGEIREDDDVVMQHHYWHKPTPWFEEGLYVSWCGKRIIKVREATESEVTLPVIHLPFDRPYMKFYGMSTIEQVMDLQEQLNRAAGMIVEARNLVARPRVLAHESAKVPAQSLSDRPGEIIKWHGQIKPSFEVPSFNFTELANHKADVRTALSQVSGITSASRGEIPTATRTALALQLVLEQDRSQYLPFIKEYHAAILATNYGVCLDAAEYIDEQDPRSYKIEGMEGAKPFHGGMVPSPLDMYLEDTNPLGWTATGRTEATMELAANKIVTDQNKILEMLKLHNDSPAYKMMKINKSAALKEIEEMNKGRALDIGPEDDDVVHLDEHTPFIASFDFRKLPKAVQDYHLAHVAQHKERLAQSQPPQGGDPGAGAGVPSGAAEDPGMTQALQAPQPGQNMEALLGSARAG